jgi:hypothetical protein
MSNATAEVQTEQVELPSVSSIMERAFLLDVRRGRFTNRRKTSIDKVMAVAVEEAGIAAPSAEEDFDALADANDSKKKVNRKFLSASKKLLQSSELKAVQSLDAEISAYIRKIALPSHFRSGMFLVPVDFVVVIDEGLRKYRDERSRLVAAFVAVYPSLIEAVRAELGDLFNAGDYPAASEIGGLFPFEWEFVTYTTPQTLKQIKASLYEEAKEKEHARVRVAVDECVQTMRFGFSELVNKMLERLTPEDTVEGPKKKIFKKSTIENLNDFLELFDGRNIAGDEKLATYVKEVKELMNGVDPERLRSDDAFREQIRSGFATVAANLETIVVDRGSRRISLDDEV